MMQKLKRSSEKIVISLRSQRRLPSTGQIWEKLFMRSLSHIGNNMTRLRNHHPTEAIGITRVQISWCAVTEIPSIVTAA